MILEKRIELLEWLAEELLKEWGLEKWKFEWDENKTTFGKCYIDKKTITLSKYLLPSITDEEAEDTIRHEIAHALHGEEVGYSDHGPRWKWWARRVGANPTACKSVSDQEMTKLAKKSKYRLECANGHIYPSHRKTKKEGSCIQCAKDAGLPTNRYYEQFIMKQIEN